MSLRSCAKCRTNSGPEVTYTAIAELAKALAHPARLRILRLAGEGIDRGDRPKSLQGIIAPAKIVQQQTKQQGSRAIVRICVPRHLPQRDRKRLVVGAVHRQGQAEHELAKRIGRTVDGLSDILAGVEPRPGHRERRSARIEHRYRRGRVARPPEPVGKSHS